MERRFPAKDPERVGNRTRASLVVHRIRGGSRRRLSAGSNRADRQDPPKWTSQSHCKTNLGGGRPKRHSASGAGTVGDAAAMDGQGNRNRASVGGGAMA